MPPDSSFGHEPGPRSSGMKGHGGVSRRLRREIRGTHAKYAAWEEISTYARDRARTAKGTGDVALAQAWKQVARIAANARDTILVAKALKAGLL